MEKNEKMAKIAKKLGLKVVNTTTDGTGHTSNGLIGFETFEQAQEIANEHDFLKLARFQKKEGWGLWHVYDVGYVNEPMTITADKYGDDYYEFNDNMMSEREFIKLEVESALRDGFETFEEIEKLIERKKRIYYEIGRMGDDEKVIVQCGVFYEIVQSPTMNWCDRPNVKFHSIGLVLED